MSSPVKVLAATFCVLLVSCGSEDAPTQEASPQAAVVSQQSANSDGEPENAGPELGSLNLVAPRQASETAIAAARAP